MHKDLLLELKEAGVKYNKEDIVFVARDKTGQLLWLETGTIQAGLKHILAKHLQDFTTAFKLEEKDIPQFLENIVTYGEVISNVPSKNANGFDRIYDYEGNYYMFAGIGSNGFIVTAFPVGK